MNVRRLLDWPIQVQVMAGPLLFFVISLLLAGSATFAMYQVQQTHADMEDSYEFLTDVNELSTLLVDMETGMRGYILARSTDFLEPYNRSTAKFPEVLTHLRQHEADNPENLDKLARLEAEIDEWRQTIAEPRIQTIRDGRILLLTLADLEKGKALFDSIRVIVDEIRVIEEGVLANRIVKSRNAARNMLVGMGIVASLGVASLLFAWLLGRRIVEPVRLLGRAADQVAKRDFSIHLPEEGHYELARTSRAFNQMVETLNTARAELIDQANVLAQQVQVAEQARLETDAVLNSVQDAIFLCATDKEVLWANQRTEEMFGVDLMKMNGMDRVDWAAAFAKVFTDGEGMRSLVLNAFEHPDKAISEIVAIKWPKPRELMMYSAPVVGRDGTSVGRVFAFHDVTREREVDRMKTEFVSLVSHEFRTPLTSIKGYTDLLSSGEVGEMSEDQKEFLQIVQTNADRLMLLINDLLDISRLEQGRVELRETTVDVAPLIQGALISLQLQMQNKQQELIVDLERALPPVQGDAGRIAQILTNLLSNAHKYTPAGGKITIAARREGDFLRVSITDTGVGMSPEEQAMLFTRFYRAKNPATQDAGGTGLGLSITRMLVEMHNGTISVQSAPNQGSTFSFTLPVATNAALPEVESAPTPAMDNAHSSAGELILIVEDEPDMAELSRWHLTRAGYHVLLASNAHEGLKMAQEYSPALILLDVLLPGTDGLTLLNWLKRDEATASIPVLLLSILPDDGQGRMLGAVDYLNKPITSEFLLNYIRTVLATKRSPLILLADSNISEREHIRQELHRGGYRTVTADTEREVLHSVDEQRPDLLMLDLQSSDLDALAILRAVRSQENSQEHASHLPVIFMVGVSHNESDYDLSALQALNHSEFLTKPFRAEELAEVIGNQRYLRTDQLSS